ncbi:uncharacterized protein V6R79_018576 [Siganus canaliculatus]
MEKRSHFSFLEKSGSKIGQVNRQLRSGRFQELDRRVCAFVDEKRKDGTFMSRAVIQLKAVEIAKELNIPTADFKRYVINFRKKHSYQLDQIGNADQTPVFSDMPTPVTVHKKDGTKLPPYVVLKRKTVPKETMPAGIIVRAQEKGWMETELVVDWLKVVEDDVLWEESAEPEDGSEE